MSWNKHEIFLLDFKRSISSSKLRGSVCDTSDRNVLKMVKTRNRPESRSKREKVSERVTDIIATTRKWLFPDGVSLKEKGFQMKAIALRSFFRGVQLLKWLCFTHMNEQTRIFRNYILVYVVLKPRESIYEMLRIDFRARGRSISSTNSLPWSVFAAFVHSLITLELQARLSAKIF